MTKNDSKINPDELYETMKDSMETNGLSPIDRKRFDELVKFNDLCLKVVSKGKGSYEFPYVYMTGKLFNRLTAEGRQTLLQDLEKEIEEWS